MNRHAVALLLGTSVAASGCARFSDYAPQTVGPSPKAVLPASVELIIDGSRPKCGYRVLGSVFAIDPDSGLEALRQRAALEGASGVYDIVCRDASKTVLGGHQNLESLCSGRVYVCGAEVGGGG